MPLLYRVQQKGVKLLRGNSRFTGGGVDYNVDCNVRVSVYKSFLFPELSGKMGLNLD